MRTISLLTIHLGSNFGSNLQTIATVETFKKHGFETIVVNYIPERCTWRRFFKNSLKGIGCFMGMFIRLPLWLINKHIYNSFLSHHVNVSKPIYPKDDFVKYCPEADVYVVGSDQVWNSKHNEGLDKRYYFDGFPETAFKIAFSSSIGREKLSQQEYNDVKRMLDSFRAISVREQSAQKLVESMGYQATHLLDPTLILNKEDWKYYMSKRLIKESYLIVYLPYNCHDKNLIYKTIRIIAQYKKLKVVSFTWGIKPDYLADKTMYFCNPGDFLSLMYYADYVITNSFHGTAFSINLNKQFSVYLPTEFGTRILSILELCGLKDRLLASNEVISSDKIDTFIDYVPVNDKLNAERDKVHLFLNKALNS